MFKTQAGSMNPEEIKKLMELIKLYSTGKSMKAKKSIPNTHYVEDLSDKSNGKWKQYLK